MTTDRPVPGSLHVRQRIDESSGKAFVDIYRMIYTPSMKEAKLFQNGRSQAVRLPKEYRLPGDSVYVRKLAGRVILIPKDQPWNR